MAEPKYKYTLSELIDRLCIVQLKETFNPDLREQYAQEIQDLIYDINISITNSPGHPRITAEILRDIIVLAQYNQHIWVNEDLDRKAEIEQGENINWEEKYKRLRLTHSLNNGVRNVAKKKIQKLVGGRIEYKNMGLAPEHENWRPSGY